MRGLLVGSLALGMFSLGACDSTLTGGGAQDEHPSDAGGAADAGGPEGPRPNIVYIVVDDLDRVLTRNMPSTRALIADQGVRFSNAFVTNALCTPSRSSMLTGKYAHNTGVFANTPPVGGHQKFRSSGS